MPTRPAIVATVRDAADVLDSFVAWHLATGFAHIWLFFDDPQDPSAGRFAGHPQVTAVRCDADLRRRWTTLRSWPKFGPHVDREVMARQILNCDLAIGLAAAAGMDWLLHIDSDELFYGEDGGAAGHFGALEARGIGNAVYMNFEALPESLETADYFREVTLFKVNIMRLGRPRFDAAQMALLRQAKFVDANFNFHLYSNGKGAARIGPDLLPATVHAFARLRPDGSLDHRHDICDDSRLILHYPNCGYSKFVTKYRTLGRFDDRWFGTSEVFAFHRQARDVVATGDEATVKRFYTERVMRHPQEDVPLLERHGLLRRIDGPATFLRSLPATA